MKNDPVRRRWVDAWSTTGTNMTWYLPRPIPRGLDRRRDISEEEAITFVEGTTLRVYLGTFERNNEGVARPQISIANCKPRQGGKFKDTYQEIFVGPREEAIEVWRAHIRMRFT